MTITDILNWVLFARINYGGSHWTGNILVVIPALMILGVMFRERMTGDSFQKLCFLFADVPMALLFTVSVHEVLFNSIFVPQRLWAGGLTLNDIQILITTDLGYWRSIMVIVLWFFVLGIVWFRGKFTFRVTHWFPFLTVIIVWVLIGLPISVRFPAYPNPVPWDYDQYIPNLFEFFYNLTFALGFIGAFGGYGLFLGFQVKFKQFLKSQKKTMGTGNP